MKKLVFAPATTIALVSFAMPASARVTHHRVISQAPVTTVYYDPWRYGAYSAYAYYPYGGYYYPGYYRSYARCYSDWGSYWCW